MVAECPFSPDDQVVAYLRDSGGQNQEDSVERQTAEIERWCRKHQIVITRWFVDEARTARTVKGREHLLEMMKYFRDGAPESGVIIWNYERFARNTKDGRFYLAELEVLSKVVHSITDYIPEGPEKYLFQAFKLYIAEQSSEKNSIDVSSGLTRLVEHHGCVPGVPPRGFKRSDPVQIGTHRNGTPRIAHKWIPDHDMLSLVQRAFEMRAKGETIRKIIDATGLYSSINSYTTFFKNRLFIGELVFGDLVIHDYCEPLITTELWDEVQRIGQRRAHPQINIDHPRRVVSQFILSGLVFCQECGSPMSGHSIGKWDYYVCSRRKRKHDCSARRIPRAPLEQAIKDLLIDRLLTLESLLSIQAEIQNAWAVHTRESGRARRDIEKQIRQVQAKIRNVTSAITENGHSKALLNQLNILEAQESDLRSDLGKLESTARPIEYTPPQMSQIAEQIKAELQDESKTRAALRGVVARVIARRTDDQITGVMYCNRVNGQVPPCETEPKTLLEFAVPIRKRKAPNRG